MWIPIILLAGAAVTLVAVALTQEHVPDHPPDLPVGTPQSTRYKLVDAIMDKLPDGSPGLRSAALTSGIPLGVLVGWIARESGGKLSDVTSLDERGYFQLMPDESKSLGLDHDRLSTDAHYSIDAGLKLIGLKYMPEADKLGIFPKGSSDYFCLVKLLHSMGSGAVPKIVNEAKTAGATSSWAAFENYATDNNDHFLSVTKHSPKKWFPFVDSVRSTGAPFGFGTGTTTTSVVGGAAAFNDIPDVLNLLPKYRGG